MFIRNKDCYRIILQCGNNYLCGEYIICDLFRTCIVIMWSNAMHIVTPKKESIKDVTLTIIKIILVTIAGRLSTSIY